MVLKALLIGLVVVVAVTLAAVLAAPALIEWNDYRAWAANRLGEWTDRTVSIHGDLSFRTLPSPALVVEDVHIANPPGADHGDLLTVGAIHMTVPWIPLLTGEVEVERLTLVEPRLIVERRAETALGWPSLFDRAGTAESIRLAEVRIENGSVIQHSPDDTTPDTRFSRIFANVSAESLNGPYQATADFDADGVPVRLEARGGRMTPAGALPLNVSLGIDGVAGALRFAGLVQADGGAQGDLILQDFDLSAALAPYMPPALPPELLVAIAGRTLSGRTGFAADADQLTLTNLTLTFGEARATGDMVLRFGGRPDIDVELAINQLEWDDVQPEVAAAMREGFATLSASVGADPTRLLSGRVSVDIDTIRVNQGLIRNARFRAVSAEQRLIIERASADLPGGSAATFSGTVRWGQGLPEAQIQVQATSSDLRRVLTWLGGDVAAVPRSGLRRATATALFSGTREAFQLTGIDATVDATRVRGGIAVLNRDVPGIGVRLLVDTLNLDSYRQPNETQHPASGTAGGGLLDAGTGSQRLATLHWLARNLPIWSHTVNANIDATFDDLVIDDIEVSDVALVVTMRNGRADVHRVSAGSFAGGRLQMMGHIAAFDPVDGLDLSLSIDLPDTAPVFTILGLASPVPNDWLGRFAADGRIALLNGALTLDIAGEAAHGRYEIAGTVTDPAGDPAYDLTARVRHDSLLRILDPFVDGYRPAEPLGGLDVYAEIAGGPDTLRLSDIRGRVGPVTVGGTIGVDGRGEKPYVDAELMTGVIALDHLLPADPRLALGQEPGDWSPAPFDLSILHRINGRLALTGTSLSRGPFTVENPALRAEMSDGTLTLARLTGTLFDGSFGLSGSISAGPPTRAMGALDLVGAEAAPFLDAAGSGRRLTGRLNLGFDGQAVGDSAASLIAGLSGEGLISVENGALAGVDLDRLGRTIDASESVAEALLGLPEALSTGVTPFATLNAPFRVQDGIIEAQDYRLVGEAGIATGQARFNLTSWDLETEAAITLYRLPDAPPATIRLDGSPDAPRRVIDVNALQGFIRERFATDRLQN